MNTPADLRTTRMPSPIGTLQIFADTHGIRAITMPGQPLAERLLPQSVGDDAGLRPVREQLAAYFAGELRDFDVDLRPQGTEFQQRVWAALTEIPFGETTTYGELAQRIESPTASRAVGAANGRNPISILVPCHRVVGKDGTLTGYAGGLPAKQWLLDHERLHRKAPALA